MSMRRSLSPRAARPNPLPPEVYAKNLGQLIRGIRLTDGRPLEELAPQAGLTVEQWEGIEAGQTPYAWECILTIAMVLHLGDSWRPCLAKLWIGAMEPRPG